jgi:type II secretory pathway component PulF
MVLDVNKTDQTVILERLRQQALVLLECARDVQSMYTQGSHEKTLEEDDICMLLHQVADLIAAHQTKT